MSDDMHTRVHVERDEIDGALAELDYWKPRIEALPRHLRDRLNALDAQEPAAVMTVIGAGPVVRVELTPMMRALIGTLRAYR